jgi:hypothetical protein
MIIKRAGAVNAPFREIFVQGKIFLSDPTQNYGEPTLEMIDWFYRTSDTIDISYDDIDDRVSVVTITEQIGDKITSSTITIGKKDKNFICHNYLYYHPDNYTRSPQGYNVLEMRKEG